MSTPTILLADNDPTFLSICTEFLETAGYQVFQASSPDEVRFILANKHVHLAVFDLRLTKDEDEKDRSGLILAKEIARSIPKLILTKFPSHEDVRDAMKLDEEALPPAVDFVDKRKELDVLLVSIRQAFADYVLINWDLRIDWKAREAFGLVKLIEQGLNNEQLLQRVDEFQDLLCKLFHDKEHIRLDRTLWQSGSRIAIVILAFKEGQKPESSVVVCGPNILVNEEAHQFEICSPKVPGGTGTLLIRRSETIHFAANSYMLKDNDLERAHTLYELYQTGPEKTLNAAITNLFQDTLKCWHEEKPVPPNNVSDYSSPSELCYIRADQLEKDAINERFLLLEHQALIIGVTIERLQNKIRFYFNGQSHIYSNPISILANEITAPELVINSPGMLTGENIVVDDFGRAWLTDFSDAGQRPLLWNYASLESSIRYDWVETNNISRRYEMEHCLISTEFAKPDFRDLEPIIRKPVRAIQVIRKLALHHIRRDAYAYNQAILFQGLRRFLSINTQSPLKSSELARLTHILISMAMLATLLGEGIEKAEKLAPSPFPELRIDEATHIVFIGDQQRRLSPRPYKLLQYLYKNSNKICTIDELRKNVIGESYNLTYIHTLVGRIREVIEIEPEHPHYLISLPNIGYRLIPRPGET